MTRAPRVLTGVYAHPDDETFSAGGTFAKYGASGVRCTLYCATDGDAGKTSGLAITTKEELGAARRRELAEAARALGVSATQNGGFPDGALGSVDQDALIGDIVLHLRRERATVVVTFGPEGAPNVHRDHRVISRAATAAFFLAGNRTAFVEQVRDGLEPHAPARLFFVSWPSPPSGASLPTLAVPATARIDVRAFRDRENAAWRAHVSQHALQNRFDELAATDDEWFSLAAGAPQAAMSDDLFAGL